jgi:hypothetical protein
LKNFNFRHIIKYEGVPGLFKGLIPNLIGVAPARYDGSYRFHNEELVILELFIFLLMQIQNHI